MAPIWLHLPSFILHPSFSRWLHLVATILLTGILFSLRCLILPALPSLAPEERIQLMGRLMARTRPALQVSSALSFLSSLVLALPQRGGSLIEIARLTLSALLLPVVWLIAIPPDYSLAPKLLPKRKALLNLALAFALPILFLAAV